MKINSSIANDIEILVDDTLNPGPIVNRKELRAAAERIEAWLATYSPDERE